MIAKVRKSETLEIDQNRSCFCFVAADEPGTKKINGPQWVTSFFSHRLFISGRLVVLTADS